MIALLRKTMYLLVTLIILWTIPAAAANGDKNVPSDTLSSRFALTPPREAYPWVIWNWMNGMISKDGIRKDLVWMNSIGISGFEHFETGGRGNMPMLVDKPLKYMSDEWKDAFRYAMHVSDSLGMEAGVESTPGWSHSGGPWVKPKDSMKKVVWRTIDVRGTAKNQTITLPEPFTVPGRYQDLEEVKDIEHWYEDIGVVAVRIPDKDKTLEQLPLRDHRR